RAQRKGRDAAQRTDFEGGRHVQRHVDEEREEEAEEAAVRSTRTRWRSRPGESIRHTGLLRLTTSSIAIVYIRGSFCAGSRFAGTACMSSQVTQVPDDWKDLLINAGARVCPACAKHALIPAPPAAAVQHSTSAWFCFECGHEETSAS